MLMGFRFASKQGSSAIIQQTKLITSDNKPKVQNHDLLKVKKIYIIIKYVMNITPSSAWESVNTLIATSGN